MASVSRHWAYHLSTPAATTDTHTNTAIQTRTARRHLSLVRTYTCVFPAVTVRDITLSRSDVPCFYRMIGTLTGVEQLSIRVNCTDERDQQTRTNRRDEIPVALAQIWLPRCTRLTTLHWKTRITTWGWGGDHPPLIPVMQHALSHLAPSLTDLRISMPAAWWFGGAYEHVMAALPPLSCLHVDVGSEVYQGKDAAQHVPTWRALTQRHAATLHTLHMPHLPWSWAAWGQLGELTQLTELDVSYARLPDTMDEDEKAQAAAVTTACNENNGTVLRH